MKITEEEKINGYKYALNEIRINEKEAIGFICNLLDNYFYKVLGWGDSTGITMRDDRVSLHFPELFQNAPKGYEIGEPFWCNAILSIDEENKRRINILKKIIKKLEK